MAARAGSKEAVLPGLAARDGKKKMLAALALSLALTAPDGAASPTRTLEPVAACRLAKRTRAPLGVVYSFAGTYIADGHHGSLIELPGCDGVFFPWIKGEVADRIQQYHSDFQKKCGGILMGDHISGVFTGAFIRRRAQLFGMQKPAMVDFFVVSDMETKDRGAISNCPK